MSLLYFADLYDGSLLDESGSETEFPPFVLGKERQISLRFFGRVAGQRILQDLDIRSFSATIGRLSVAPTSGTWRARIGALPVTTANTIPAQPLAVNATTLATAFNSLPAAVPYGTCTGVDAGAGMWVLTFAGNTGAVPIEGAGLLLDPVSFLKVRAYLENGVWRHELRLVQAPIAITSMAARVAAAGPEITRVRAGGTVDGVSWNEVQALMVPAAFRGTFALHKGYGQTELLDRTDFAEDIQDALNAKFGTGSFKVTNPTDYVFHIEFAGDFGGVEQDLLTVTVETEPLGDWTFNVDLTKAMAYTAMRGKLSQTFLLSIDAMVGREGEAPELPGHPEELLRVTITVIQEHRTPGVEAVPAINWAQPPEPSSHRPFNPSTVLFGEQHYGPVVIGDGVHVSHDITHNLGTMALASIEVAENLEGGRALVRGVDYTARLMSANVLRLTFLLAVPGVDALAAIITAAGPKSAFITDLEIEIGQVVGLQTILNAHGAAIEELLAVLPSTGPGTTAASGEALSWKPEPRFSIFPRATDAAVLAVLAKLKISGEGDAAKLPAIDESTLPRPGYLVRAVSASTVEEYSGPTWPPSTGDIWNTLPTEETTLGGGNGFRSFLVEDDGFIIKDRGQWFLGEAFNSTRTWYPKVFNREFAVLDVNDQQFAIGATFELQFRVGLQLLRVTDDTDAACQVVIEFGAFAADAGSPARGPNLQKVEWVALPVMAQPIKLSREAISHRFGVRVKRNVSGLGCDKLVYGRWIGGATAPASANFAVRARLINFDAENAGDPRGYLFTAFYDATATISS